MRHRLSLGFAKVLRRERMAAGLSQEALAHAAGLHRTYVGMIERGLRNPTLDAASALVGALGLRLADLIAEVEQGAHR